MEPFGRDNETPTGSETYKFTGKPYSSNIGLYYHFQRWYDPEIGRFISQDPIPGHVINPQGQNRYLYASNLPTVLTDPSGLYASFRSRQTSCADPVKDYWGSLWHNFVHPECWGSAPVGVMGAEGGAITMGEEAAGWLGPEIGAISMEDVAAFGLGLTGGGIIWDLWTGSFTSAPEPLIPRSFGGGGRLGGALELLRGGMGAPSIGGLGTRPITTPRSEGGEITNIYRYIAKVVRYAKNNPNVARVCAVGAVLVGTGLYVWETVEAARQGLEPPDPEGIIRGIEIGCLFGIGAAILLPF